MYPGFDSRTRRHMWVEFVVGSLICSERFFSGSSGFPLSSKTNISKFQFDLQLSSILSLASGSGDCANTVFDIKFDLHFSNIPYKLKTVGFMFRLLLVSQLIS